MKPSLLANENFSMPSIMLLRKRGYDILSVAELARSIADQQILSVAVAESLWILTFDRGYGELIYRPEKLGYLLIEILEISSQFHGYFVVVEKDVWRKRRLPKR